MDTKKERENKRMDTRKQMENTTRNNTTDILTLDRMVQNTTTNNNTHRNNVLHEPGREENNKKETEYWRVTKREQCKKCGRKRVLHGTNKKTKTLHEVQGYYTYDEREYTTCKTCIWKTTWKLPKKRKQ